MVCKFKSIAVAGALMMVAAPAFAQDMQLPLVGDMGGMMSGMGGLDLDPFHIFTPAPAAAPMMMKKPMMHKHMMMHHKMMSSKMMMKKKMMMEKKPM